MQVIYCNINIFDYDQEIYLVKDDNSRLIAKVPFTDLGKALPGLCNDKATYNVHLFCNVSGMAQQAADSIVANEIKKYGQNKIEVEIN
jgi:hypothetical protein